MSSALLFSLTIECYPNALGRLAWRFRRIKKFDFCRCNVNAAATDRLRVIAMHANGIRAALRAVARMKFFQNLGGESFLLRVKHEKFIPPIFYNPKRVERR